MFLEVHPKGNEGRPILMNTRNIQCIGKTEAGGTYFSIESYNGKLYAEEEYEDIRRALHNEIASVGHDESIERVVWRRNININHTCSVCGTKWTGYGEDEMCPKCGTLDVPF